MCDFVKVKKQRRQILGPQGYPSYPAVARMQKGLGLLFPLFCFKTYFYYLCVCVCMCTMCVQCPQKPGEGDESPGTGAIGSCEAADISVGNRTQVL